MSPEPSSRLRILVLEDNQEVLDYLALLLGLERHVVTLAHHGREALDLLRQGARPDLILLDLMMPVMDGWQFRREQLADPALARIPVVVLSARGNEAGKEDTLGDVGYLQKPVDPPELLALLRRFTAPRKVGVLVVDDEDGIRRMLGMALRHSGFTPFLAGGGKEALEIYQQHRSEIDVVLLDVQMPHPDGPQTLRCLRAVNPDVRAVFMSGHTGRYSSEDLKPLGAACVVAKPFNLAELTGILRRTLGNLLTSGQC